MDDVIKDMENIYFKYPRTPHLPWSLGTTNDDRILDSVDHFEGKDIIISCKMDGENCNWTPDKMYARSIDSGNHESRDWVKRLHSNIKHQIPFDWRICGENLYAKHTIHYKNLRSYFVVYSIWNEENVCLNWKDTLEYCEMLKLDVVSVIYEGKWNLDYMQNLWYDLKNGYDDDEVEGYVVRLAGEFSYGDFNKSVAKFVRKGHVQTDKHWMFQKIVPNELRKG